ncbi:hypothetical protein FRC09_006684, partial [Ceratobasidium sp. 395]
MSEIDDIFASKPKSKGKTKEAEENPPKDTVSSKKKRKKKKKADVAEPPTGPEPEVVPVAGEKRKMPETVVDPSLVTEPKAKKKKDGKKNKSDTTRAENSDDERFKDSRGTGP